jgi:hypothetical protein
MEYTFKKWNKNDYYDFYVEFNRIESYNEYCKEWLSYFGIELTFTSKVDWTKKDIVDLNDFNRVKTNINLLLNTINSNINQLSVSSQINQVWNVDKANELEVRLKEYLKYVGELQFLYNVTGLTTTGNSLKLGGV